MIGSFCNIVILYSYRNVIWFITTEVAANLAPFSMVPPVRQVQVHLCWSVTGIRGIPRDSLRWVGHLLRKIITSHWITGAPLGQLPKIYLRPKPSLQRQSCENVRVVKGCFVPDMFFSESHCHCCTVLRRRFYSWVRFCDHKSCRMATCNSFLEPS